MQTREIHIPDKASRLMAALEAAGHEAFMVGGAVRDALLGRPVDDIDIASDAGADAAMRILAEAGARVVPTGIAHGTITAVLEGESFEVTAFRIDGSYSDSRHPDSVSPARSIEEDLARRDFTINAMAYNDQRGLVDPFGGRLDLEKSIIRCVGDPAVRFGEDALRMLRALRFAAQLGFSIDGPTASAIHACRQSLAAVSIERINTELSKTICAPEGAAVLRGFPDIASAIVPATATPEGALAWQEGLQTLDNIDGEDLSLRLAALFGRFDGCQRILMDLRFPKSIVSSSMEIIDAANRTLPCDDYAIKLLLRDFGFATVRAALPLRKARATGCNGELADIERVAKRIDEIEKDAPCFTLEELAVDGAAIKEKWGIEGRDVGRTLDYLLDLVMRGILPNERYALLAERPPFLD